MRAGPCKSASSTAVETLQDLTRADSRYNLCRKSGEASKFLPSFHMSEAWKCFMKTSKADCKSTADLVRERKQPAIGVQIARKHELAAASKQSGRFSAALHF